MVATVSPKPALPVSYPVAIISPAEKAPLVSPNTAFTAVFADTDTLTLWLPVADTPAVPAALL